MKKVFLSLAVVAVLSVVSCKKAEEAAPAVEETPAEAPEAAAESTDETPAAE